MKQKLPILLCSLFLSFLLTDQSFAQRRKRNSNASASTMAKPIFHDSLYNAMKWRNIGPFRGGRSTTATGVTSKPHTYFMGSTGGGVWKTTDGGHKWKNISDGFFKTGSVGAIAVSESDPNVIYVGMGEAPVRGVMTSHGDGVYKSVDGGVTWENVGLKKTRQISKIQIHPKNPDLVYVAAQGSPHAPTAERGIYKSQDGGKTWELVLHVNQRSGASDLSMDVTNPRNLYAAFWEHQRFPWKVESGGEGSGIYKSSDGGETWNELTEGLPKSVMGKIGVAVSPAFPQRVWAIIESEEGGLYRSDDAGKTWQLINEDRILRARSWYYMHIFAHPTEANTVFVLNAPMMKSTDGGKTFVQVPTPHGDNHGLWINPENPQLMINANDGGANITYNAGRTWSTQGNQPTAQFYRVNADNRFPYYVYGGQQDNSSVALVNRNEGQGLSAKDFYAVGGCESAFPAFDPNDPRFIYAGCYQGIISEYDHQTNRTKSIMAYPFLGLGTKPADLKYRFNWNAPIIVSQHDTKVIYHAAQKLLKSEDRGVSWKEISPELTRNDSTKLDWGGGPITNEAAGGEVYHTIYYVAESPHDGKVIYTGSDDGLVHITKDGGTNWQNITPPNIGEAMINAIEVSPHDPATAYIAVNRYKFNDFTPHVFKTTDFGATWTRLVQGIEEEAHVRVVREDLVRKDLLYAGTETGIYISFNGGQQWDKFQLNLPIVPITDLKVHQNDLVAATQGRAFWILDDLTPLHQLNETVANSEVYLFKPREAYKMGGVRIDTLHNLGANPDNGTVIYYYLKSVAEDDSLDLTVEILNQQDEVLRTYESAEENKAKQASKKSGMNKLVWDMRREGYETPTGILPFQGLNGGKVTPDNYKVKLSYRDTTFTQSFEVKADPRIEVSTTQYAKQQKVLMQIESYLGEVYNTVIDLQSVRSQIQNFQSRIEEDTVTYKEVIDTGKELVSQIDSLESLLVQPKQKTFQDVINFPNQLDANWKHLQNNIDSADPPITKGSLDRFKDLEKQWMMHREAVGKLMDETLKSYNDMIEKMQIPMFAPKVRME